MLNTGGGATLEVERSTGGILCRLNDGPVEASLDGTIAWWNKTCSVDRQVGGMVALWNGGTLSGPNDRPLGPLLDGTIVQCSTYWNDRPVEQHLLGGTASEPISTIASAETTQYP